MLLAAALLAVAQPVQALEPLIAQQITPDNPHLLFLGRDEAGRLQFIETATAGVMAETGFGWVMTVDARNDVPTMFERMIADCTNNILMTDWITYLDDANRAADHHRGTDVRLANVGPGYRIIEAICHGVYSGSREEFDGVAPAVAWANDVAANEFDLGSVIKLYEVGDRYTFDVSWVRYGRSDLYKGVYTNVANGLRGNDVLRVRGVKDGVLQVDRLGAIGTATPYTFPINPDGSIGRGHAAWEKKPGSYIEVLSRE